MLSWLELACGGGDVFFPLHFRDETLGGLTGCARLARLYVL